MAGCGFRKEIKTQKAAAGKRTQGPLVVKGHSGDHMTRQIYLYLSMQQH
jgi:hypothetical protein